MSGFKCQECGKKFKTVRAAERASMNGCPKCGGCDIDTDVEICRPRNSEPSPGFYATQANAASGQ